MQGDTTYFEKYTEWDVYLRGKGKTRVKTPPTKVSDAISVIVEQEGLNKADIIGVMINLRENPRFQSWDESRLEKRFFECI